MDFSIAAPAANDLSAGADNPRTLQELVQRLSRFGEIPRDGQHSPAAREARTNGE